MKRITIVGGSLAGVEAARAVRSAGFDGRLTMINAEPHPPYDRPPLSKGFLTGGLDVDACGLADLAELDVIIRSGQAARSLDPTAGTVTLTDGTVVGHDGVVVATGARARTLPGTEGLAGVHTLRTLDDAVALRARLREASTVVVVGGGFIGAEVASSARSLGCQVTVVEAAAVPFERQLGATIGGQCARLHADHGVRLLTGAAVESVSGSGSGLTVRVTDGRSVPADLVVAGIGSVPATEWLAGSGVRVDDGVVCDATGASSVPNIVAAGDCARWWSPREHRHSRHEHWTAAMEQAHVAANRLVRGEADPYDSPAYFWSDQYGVRIQVAGTPGPADRSELVEGDYGSYSFVVTFTDRAGVLTAVVAMDQPKLFGRWRRSLAARRATAALAEL